MRIQRINAILFLFFIFTAAIISRLFFLQIISHKLYQSQALGQQVGFSEVQGSRGQIFFKDSRDSKGQIASGEIKSLAINKKIWTLAVVPSLVTDKNIFAKEISKITGLTQEAVALKLDGESNYYVLKKNLSDQELLDLNKLDLKGIRLDSVLGRYYPQENLASDIVGFLGGDGTGQYGIEGYYDNILKGKTGIQENKRGLDLIGEDTQMNLDGSDLYLTIDYNIQFEAESLLKQAKKDLDIDNGQIIVLKPDSGRVLALADFPSFDPNNFSKENNLDIFQNSAVQKIFEPGSVMKPFTMAIAINEGKITPETSYVDTGMIKVGQNTIYNFGREKYGQQTMTGVLEKSINTGAVFASKTVTHETFFNYLNGFALDQKTGIDLQGENYSKNDILRNGSEVGFITASFGQGIEMTPLELARGFCVIANGGNLVKPYIVEKIINGKDERNIKSEIIGSIISEKTAMQVTNMLISVVEKGFGKSAKVPGYYLAGKTGTAEVPIEGGRGYYTDKTIQSFIGFGPALNPKFLILVKLDNPKVSASSVSAAPIFNKLAQYIINYWQIPPDYTDLIK
jgi:cell division protein FtsI (penicillin-binding protein 3)/stage V sporulation protein D (sporulation-specific penicillin-binding protein)